VHALVVVVLVVAVLAITLRIMFASMIFIGMSDSCHYCDSSIWFNENPNSDPMLLD